MFVENDFELNDFLHTQDFESTASTIPPLRQVFFYVAYLNHVSSRKINIR